MNVSELRDMLTKLPKAFDAVDVGISGNNDQSGFLDNVFWLCGVGEKMMITLARCTQEDVILQAGEPMPQNKDELLKFLDMEIMFNRDETTENKTKAYRWLSNLRTAIQLEMEGEEK